MGCPSLFCAAPGLPNEFGVTWGQPVTRQCHSGEGRNPGPDNVIPAKAGIQAPGLFLVLKTTPDKTHVVPVEPVPGKTGKWNPGPRYRHMNHAGHRPGGLWIPAPGLRRGRLRREDMGWGEHGHSQGGRALPTEMYAGGPICGRGVLPGDEHKNVTATPPTKRN